MYWSPVECNRAMAAILRLVSSEGMSPFLIGVLICVLCGVPFGVMSEPARNGVSCLVSALHGVLTLSSFVRGARLRRLPGLAALAVAASGGWSPVGPGRRSPVRPEDVFLLSQTLTERDWEILQTVNRLRLVTAQQIERVHFSDLKESSRPVVRRRVLKRLHETRAVIALPRRVGGKQHGSEQKMFALDAAGAQLLEQRYNWKDPQPRNLTVPGAMFQRHRIAVSELFVRLIEASRQKDSTLIIEDFQTEPACWWPYSYVETSRHKSTPQKFLKPDAYILAYRKNANHYGSFWVEVDLGTEPVWRVLDKVILYAEFDRTRSWTHERVPLGEMPRILITTHTERRRDAIRHAIETHVYGHHEEWKGGGEKFLHEALKVRVACFDDAVTAIVEQLPE